MRGRNKRKQWVELNINDIRSAASQNSSSFEPNQTPSINSYRTNNPHMPHSRKCSICGSKELVVTCKVCEEIFCNIDNSNAGSHIHNHFLEENHLAIQIVNNRHEITDIECSSCGNSSVFSLGFFKKSNKIICRVPCLINKKGNIQDWHSIIDSKKLDFRVFKTANNSSKIRPSIFHFDYKNNGEISLNNEREYVYNTGERFNQINSSYNEFNIRRIYESVDQYLTIQHHFLFLEDEAEQLEYNKAMLSNISIYFNEEFNRTKAYFYGLEIGCRFSEKDEIIIFNNSLN